MNRASFFDRLVGFARYSAVEIFVVNIRCKRNKLIIVAFFLLLNGLSTQKRILIVSWFCVAICVFHRIKPLPVNWQRRS